MWDVFGYDTIYIVDFCYDVGLLEQHSILYSAVHDFIYRLEFYDSYSECEIMYREPHP